MTIAEHLTCGSQNHPLGLLFSGEDRLGSSEKGTGKGLMFGRDAKLRVCVCMGWRWGLGDPRWLKGGVTVISLLLRLTRQRALMGGAGSLLSKRLQTDCTLHFLSGITV